VLAVEEDGLTLDEMDAELDTKTSLDIALDTTMELEAAIELDGLLLDARVDEDRIDDEGTASHFPKPGWHPVPQ
jgi:hypothetical protein